MPREQRTVLSKYRLSRAEETLYDAEHALAEGRYENAANRAYYAAFNALRAVLALDGIDRKHHSGVISEFRRLYVKTGTFQNEISRKIDSLSDIRNRSDYEDFYKTEKDDAAQQVRDAETVVDAVRKYLQNVYVSSL